MTSILKADNIQNASGSNLINESGSVVTIGANGNNIVIPVGATITNSGTQVGFGGVNTPAFQAKKLTTQSFSTNITAVVLFDSEDFDTASAYDTVTGKFTPQTAGKYLIHGQIAFTYSGGNDYIVITKNGTAIKWGQNYPSGTAQYKKQDTSVILELNGTTDYVQIEGLTSYVGTNTLGTSLLGTGDACTFYGYKIIE